MVCSKLHLLQKNNWTSFRHLTPLIFGDIDIQERTKKKQHKTHPFLSTVRQHEKKKLTNFLIYHELRNDSIPSADRHGEIFFSGKKFKDRANCIFLRQQTFFTAFSLDEWMNGKISTMISFEHDEKLFWIKPFHRKAYQFAHAV